VTARAASLASSLSLALIATGCTTLGGNVQGDFACRAPGGSCAPTSMIDEQATRVSPADGSGALAPVVHTPANTSGRSLRVVLAGYRDAQGREHEPRVVHVPLPESPGTGFRSPLSTGEVLRALGRAVQHEEGMIAPSEFASPLQLPDQLVNPSQLNPELPGAEAPVTGGTRSSPPPRPGAPT
jgi:conjugal transfer pilus assembly protein TraV